MICSRGRRDEQGERSPAREERAGVSITRVAASAFGRGKTSGRMADYASFHLFAGLRVLANRWADVTVTLTTPPLLGLWGSLGARLGGPKHVTFLMDHHPDAEFELGMIDRASFAGRSAEGLYRWTLRNASHNVSLGPYQDERVARRDVPAHRRAVIPIWSSADEIVPVPHAQNVLRRDLGWEGRFVVLYSGNAGLVHSFDELLETVRLLQQRSPDVLFAFVGGGPRMPEVQEAVRREELTNAVFLPSFQRGQLSQLLSAADMHFVSLRPQHVGVSVPGKLYGQLASARPIAFVGPSDCETADDLRSARAGVVLPVGAGKRLAREIECLREDPERCERMGQRGRAWFLEHRERERSCESWRSLLEALAAGRAPQTVQEESTADERRRAA